jgi:2-keto-3-deoxy-L-rhamnonate aldolase RhmA
MFRNNALKRRLAAGGRALGCWLNMASPMAAEIIALAGAGFVLIDNEHGPGTESDLLAILHAVSATPASTVLRIPANDPVAVKRALDLGVEGLMFPNIESAEEARAAVAACRYPPAGRRGSAYGTVRASDYGLCGERYRDTCGDELLVIVQIESERAVAAIPDIAAVPGIDCLFVGPYDLSGSIGRLGRFDDPAVIDLLDRAGRAIVATGLCYGTIPVAGRPVEALLAAGCRLVVAGGDVSFIRRGALAQVEAFRRACGDASAVSGS